MTEWWDGLHTIQKVFYGAGIPSAFVLFVQLLLTLIGTELHTDVDFSADHADGAGLISIRSVAAFFFGFGWTGALVYKATEDTASAIAAGSAVGVVLMALLFYLMKFLSKMRHSGNLDYHNAIGVVGSVYVAIPPTGKGSGQVEILLQGRLAMAEACTNHTEEIKPREKVKVVGLMGENTLVVAPISLSETTHT